MEKEFDIAIVGAGPSGLAAAINAKIQRPDSRIIIIEKMNEAGKKLNASGNGRGNLSNKSCGELERVLDFFSQVGIAVRMDEEGRIYPYSEEAKAVTSTLVKRAKSLGVTLLVNTKVSNVEVCPKNSGSFRIFISADSEEKPGKKPVEKGAGKSVEREIKAKKVLIAAGGKSFAVYGSTGDGFTMARKLGHEVKSPIPALTAVEVAENIKSLKGVRAKAEVTLLAGNDVTFRERGEVQFKDDSISGICVMNLSSKLPIAESSKAENPLAKCKVMINFVPDFETINLMKFLKNEATMVGNNAAELLETLVKKPVAAEILRRCEISPEMRACELAQRELMEIANCLRGFILTPCGRKGWKEAQVTKGGVSTAEIDEESMESSIVPGLYFAGEVIDYDGPCGGYNLHNAWLTGIKAGIAMAKSL